MICRSGFPVMHQVETLPNGRNVSTVLGGNEVVPCPAWDGRLLTIILYVVVYGGLALVVLSFASRTVRWWGHRKVAGTHSREDGSQLDPADKV